MAKKNMSNIIMNKAEINCKYCFETAFIGKREKIFFSNFKITASLFHFDISTQVFAISMT